MPEMIPAAPGSLRRACDYCGKTFITTPGESTCDRCLRELIGDDPEYRDA